MRHGWIVLLSVLCLLLSGDLARSAEPSTHRYVLVVANNRSTDAAAQPLQYADDDGALFYRLLQPLSHHVVLLTVLDDASQSRFPDLASQTAAPPRANVLSALRGLYDQIRADQAAGVRTELLFIFIGHGSLDESGKGVLHLADGRWTRADLFREIVQQSPASRTHLILDACNAYAVIAGRGDANGAKQEPPEVALEQFLTGHDLDAYPTVGALIATTPAKKSRTESLALRETAWSRRVAPSSKIFHFYARSA